MPPLTPLRVKDPSKYMLQYSSLTGALLSHSPFDHKIGQGLGLDHHLGHIGYVEARELECPLADPSRGEMVPDNFPEPK
jgi:hypothetical protein